jgi:hypothetical protein
MTFALGVAMMVSLEKWQAQFPQSAGEENSTGRHGVPAEGRL